MTEIARALHLLLVVTVMLSAASAAPATTRTSPEDRLAAKFAQVVSLVLRQEPLTVARMEIAAAMAGEASALAPGNAELARLAYAVAGLAEHDDLREAALARVAALDPDDQVARLRTTAKELRQYQTADDLANALERLLEPQSRERMGGAVSSRLAMDLALLERRRGEDERFADRLAQAVALDPSNQHAAALAAGYFQMHVDDPVAEGELLLQLVRSNPISVENIILLATHLLGHGAYAGAERFYDIAHSAHAVLRNPAAPDLVADAAIAQFGRGDAAGAMRRLADRQRQADAVLHQRLQARRPDITPRDRAYFVAVLSPTFATVRAAIHSRARQDVQTQVGLAAAAYEQAILDLASAEQSEQEQNRLTALLRLEQAWVSIWLGGDLEAVETALGEARSIAELSEAAEKRFNGWKALRRGEHDDAISTLEEVAAADAPSQLGYALALLDVGRQRDGARELLAIARAQPGTLIGVYAADVLAEVLGRRVALSQEASQLDALAAGFPRALDRIMADPTTAVGFSIVPADSRFGAYEPLIFNIEITNNSPVPLAIDPSGPIEPEIAIIPSVQVVRTRIGSLPPIIVSIEQRLRLMPRQRLIVPIDLRNTLVGDLLDRVALTGGIVRLRGVLNFRATPEGAIVPGLLGSETRPSSVWVDGVRLTPEWINESLATIAEQSAAEIDATRLALFGLAMSGQEDPNWTAEERRIVDDARQTVAAVFARLDGPTQAWLLSVWPRAFLSRFAPPERYADHRLVQLAHLVFRIEDRNDPLIAEAIRGDDPNLRRIATLLREHLPADGGLLQDPTDFYDD